MNNLKQILKDLKVKYIKEGKSHNIISVILGEVERKIDPNNTDLNKENKEVINICKKLKITNEEIVALIDPIENKSKAQQFTDLLEEINFIDEFISDYGPQELPFEMIHDLVKNYIYQHPCWKMGDIMKYFKYNYDGQYSGSTLSEIVKTYL